MMIVASILTVVVIVLLVIWHVHFDDNVKITDEDREQWRGDKGWWDKDDG